MLPDGRQVSLPIPVRHSPSSVRFADLYLDGIDVGSLVSSLTNGRISADHLCHLDPDLDRDARPRHQDWKPAFGQVAAALKHLQRCEVGVGDLFLFFGWFRKAQQASNGQWQFVPKAPHLHQLFGWLQVGAVVEIQNQTAQARRQYPALADHPHLLDGWQGNNNLFIAADSLTLEGTETKLPGAGCFADSRDDLVLTDRTQTKRSVWRLPGWMLPNDGKPVLSYHYNADRWSRDDRDVILQTVGRGQEFVLDTATMAQAVPWLRALFQVGVT